MLFECHQRWCQYVSLIGWCQNKRVMPEWRYDIRLISVTEGCHIRMLTRDQRDRGMSYWSQSNREMSNWSQSDREMSDREQSNREMSNWHQSNKDTSHWSQSERETSNWHQSNKDTLYRSQSDRETSNWHPSDKDWCQSAWVMSSFTPRDLGECTPLALNGLRGRPVVASRFPTSKHFLRCSFFVLACLTACLNGCLFMAVIRTCLGERLLVWVSCSFAEWLFILSVLLTFFLAETMFIIIF